MGFEDYFKSFEGYLEKASFAVNHVSRYRDNKGYIGDLVRANFSGTNSRVHEDVKLRKPSDLRLIKHGQPPKFNPKTILDCVVANFDGDPIFYMFKAFSLTGGRNNKKRIKKEMSLSLRKAYAFMQYFFGGVVVKYVKYNIQDEQTTFYYPETLPLIKTLVR